MRKRRRLPSLFAIFVLLTLLTVVVSAYMCYDILSKSRISIIKPAYNVVVPDCVGMSLTELKASEPYISGELGFSFEYRYDSASPAEKIFRQYPEAGRIVKNGQNIRLVVGLGPHKTVLADMRGANAEDTVSYLKNADLHVILYPVFDDAHPENTVVRTEPAAGAVVYGDDSVTVYVSKGPNPYPLPDAKPQRKKKTDEIPIYGFGGNIPPFLGGFFG